jgi:acetoin:2,6-dichlorophenolindophenol oxidoreductase subunit beta
MSNITFLQAIAQATAEEMRRDPTVFVLGEDVRSALFGGTAGLVEEFGLERVRDTPISEEGFVGAAIGAAMTGMRPIVDMTIASFLFPAADQIINQAAKNRFLFGGQCSIPIVIRAGMFSGSAAQHTDRPYPMFMNVPGLKIVVPSTPSDVLGLLRTAVRDDDPVLIFEDQLLWGSRGEVSDDEFLVPLGSADIKRPGDDVTVVAIASAVPQALSAANELAREGISIEVIDPRSLVPLDTDTILGSLRKTGRLVIADPANKTCGAAAEIAAIAVEEAFEYLKTGVVRVTSPDTHMGSSRFLFASMYPTQARIVAGVKTALGQVARASLDAPV